MSTPSASQQAQALARRKMRKGTHSCAECRRRKIRCIFSRNDPNTCIECNTRGLPCEEQVPQDPTPGENRHNLRERVGKLESMMEALLRERQSTDKSKLSTEEQDRITAEAAEALHHLRSYSPDSAGSPPGGFPIYEGNARFVSLFDNAVLTRNRDGESNQGSNYSSPVASTQDHASPNAFLSREKNQRNRRALLEIIPDPPELDKILEDSTQYLSMWRKLLPEIGGCQPEMTLHQFVKWGLAQDDITIVANAMLAVGLCVHQRPAKAEGVQLKLPIPRKKLLRHYLYVLEALNIPDDAAAASPGGIELIIVRAKIYDNLGMVRKGWLMFRKAIALVQMMGYHSTRPVFPGEPQDSIDRRNNIWIKLAFMDRWLSMIIGLPYMMRDEPQPLEFVVKLGRSAKFRRNLTIVVGRVINQSQSDSPPVIETTLDIDRELNNIASSLPLDWWDKSVAIASGTWDPNEALEKLALQMWYHQSKAYLHLPFMLQSATSPNFEYSRVACLEASRRMIGIYLDIRGGDKAFFISRVFDFQGFVAGMFLVLGLLGYSRQVSTDSEDQKAQEQLDWHLLDSLMNLMRSITAQDPDNTISSQSLAVLETLTRFSHNPSGLEHSSPSNPSSSVKIAVPFFGTIHIHAPFSRSRTQSPSSSTSPSIPAPPRTLSDRAPSAVPAHIKPEYNDVMLTPYQHQRLVAQPHQQHQSFSTVLDPLASTANSSMQPGSGDNQWPPQIDVNFETWAGMDLDQDWGWMVGGAGGGTMDLAASSAPSVGVGEDINMAMGMGVGTAPSGYYPYPAPGQGPGSGGNRGPGQQGWS